jgi:DNA processing protein
MEALLDRFPDPEEVFQNEPATLAQVPGIGSKLANQIIQRHQVLDVDEVLAICQKHEIRILDFEDPSYPRSLAEIHNPPPILYLYGDLLEEDTLAIAIVGSRHATTYGKRITERLARGLATAGYTIVSGLARGIDSSGHRGALAAGGRTIAVLGSGLLEIYPPEHLELAQAIRKQGVLISEFPPYRPAKGSSFPQRNRIISGLSLGTIVVEASHRSGALITARLAMEQGREVFAVPGPVDSRMSTGCHRLIRDGAKLVESIDDVIDELGPLIKPIQSGCGEVIHHPAELQLNDVEKAVLAAIESRATEIDRIADTTGLPINRVLATISVLEVRQLISRVSGNSVARR